MALVVNLGSSSLLVFKAIRRYYFYYLPRDDNAGSTINRLTRMRTQNSLAHANNRERFPMTISPRVANQRVVSSGQCSGQCSLEETLLNGDIELPNNPNYK